MREWKQRLVAFCREFESFSKQTKEDCELQKTINLSFLQLKMLKLDC